MNAENLEILLSQSNPPLRQRRQRTNFNDEAIQSLEDAFAKNPYPDINEREEMARELKTTEDRIQVWFQNKRARYRKKMHKETVVTTSTKSLPKKKQSNVENFPDQLSTLPLKEERRIESTPTPIDQNRVKLLNVPTCFDSSRLVSTPKVTNNSIQSDQHTPSNQTYYSPYVPNDSGFVSSSNSSLVDLNRTYLNSLNLNAQFQMLAALNSPFYLYSSYQSTTPNSNFTNVPSNNVSIANIPLPVIQQSTPELHLNRSSKPFFKPYE